MNTSEKSVTVSPASLPLPIIASSDQSFPLTATRPDFSSLRPTMISMPVGAHAGTVIPILNTTSPGNVATGEYYRMFGVATLKTMIISRPSPNALARIA